MRNLVLVLAFLLDGLASSDAVSVSAQTSQRKVSELDGPWRIDGNRALQVAKEDDGYDEERNNQQAVETAMHTLESSPILTKNTEPMLEKTLETPVVAKALEELPDSPGLIKRFKSFLERIARWILAPWRKWRIRSQQRAAVKHNTQAAVKQYTELQTLLASTSGYEGYDKIMLLGHTPISWKNMIDARGTEGFTDLPEYKPLDQETEFVRLNEFTTHYLAALGHRKGKWNVLATWPETYKSLTDVEKHQADKLVIDAEEKIQRVNSADDLIAEGISPLSYLRVLIKNGDIKSPKDSAIKAVDQIHILIELDKLGGLGRDAAQASVIESLKNSLLRIRQYITFAEGFEKKLLTAKKDLNTATVVPHETAKIEDTLSTPMAVETLKDVNVPDTPNS